MLRPAGKVLVMAAIVDTMMIVPAVALIALVAFAAFDVSFYALLTFGGALGALQGALAWWALGFVPALAYAIAITVHH